jgi:hypothetical protein
VEQAQLAGPDSPTAAAAHQVLAQSRSPRSLNSLLVSPGPCAMQLNV